MNTQGNFIRRQDNSFRGIRMQDGSVCMWEDAVGCLKEVFSLYPDSEIWDRSYNQVHGCWETSKYNSDGKFWTIFDNPSLSVLEGVWS